MIEAKNTMSAAINKWEVLLGEESVITNTTELEKYKVNTIGAERLVPAALKVNDSKEIPHILKIANEYAIALYTISTGNNWGYGSANPVKNDCVILDLSELNKIIEFNEELGYVVLEPGVTQAILYEYIQRNNLDYLVPTTGAGPSCSIIGNLLERGYGITPYSDHFSSLNSLEVVLANGTIYRSALHEFDAHNVANIFKWGIGPYLDGIFTQSNFGIVTKATVALARRKESLEAFMFPVFSAERIKKVIPVIKALKEELDGIIGGVNLMNSNRMESMKLQSVDRDGSIKHPDWTGLGALYGNPKIVREAKKIVKNQLRKAGVKPVFINQKRLAVLKKITHYSPNSILTKFPNFVKQTYIAQSFFDVLNGIPSQVALPLVYKYTNIDLTGNKELLNPANDNCGLIWFSPLIPINTDLVSDFVKNVVAICIKHNVEPLITLTTVSNVCFDSTIPILFKKEDTLVKKGKQCFEELTEMAREMGLMPYRTNIDAMNLYDKNKNLTSIQLIKQIKTAIDPNNILSPGRYNL